MTKNGMPEVEAIRNAKLHETHQEYEMANIKILDAMQRKYGKDLGAPDYRDGPPKHVWQSSANSGDPQAHEHAPAGKTA